MTTRTPASNPDESKLAARCVRHLLERHGIPRHKHSTVIGDVLEMSYSQAHRKVGATATWSLEEIARLATHFGESLAEVVEAGQLHDSQEAVLVMGPLKVPCRVWLGKVVDPPYPPQLAAIGTPGRWLVMPSTEVRGVPALQVQRLVVEQAPVRARRVAVVTERADMADLVARQLEGAGFEPQLFASVQALCPDERPQRHDAYVIDWVLGRRTSRELIERIRSQDTRCPIVIIAGEMNTEFVSEYEVAEAVPRYGLALHREPVRPMLVAAELLRAFTAQTVRAASGAL